MMRDEGWETGEMEATRESRKAMHSAGCGGVFQVLWCAVLLRWSWSAARR